MPEEVDHPTRPMEEVIREDGRYPAEAFEFLHAAMREAVGKVHGEDRTADEDQPDQRHVTGQDICLAVRELAVKRWGLMARAVLAKWNVHGTMDFGNMVYLLIRNRYMRKTEEDSIEDFREVFDFAEAFDQAYQFDLKE